MLRHDLVRTGVSTRLMAGVLLAAFAAAPARAADRHVPAEHPTIQAAIDAADPGDRVVVADGVHGGPGNVDLSLGGKPLRVTGANGAVSCTIDGSATPGARGFLFDDGETASSVVEGFTFTGFSTTGAPGVIRCVGSHPAILDCVFRDNRTVAPDAPAETPTPAGSALAFIDSSAQTRRTLFEDNVGAPVLVDAESVVYIIDCTFAGNVARIGAGDDSALGGAAIDSRGFPLLFDTVLMDNTATVESGPARGGAISHRGLFLDLTQCTFEANAVVGADATGAAVYATAGFVMNGGVVRGHAGEHAGAAFAIDGDEAEAPFEASLTGPRFEDNSVGGLRIDDATSNADVVLRGAAFCGNTPYHVSGLYRTASGTNEVCCPGDVDGAGTVDFGDLLAVLAAWGACGGCPEDVDGSGIVDFADLLAVLSAWGACPTLDGP